MPRVGFDIRIDTSEPFAIAQRLCKNLSPDQIDRLMYRTLKETGAKVKTETKRAVVQDYEVTQGWVAQHLGAPKMSGGGGHWSCIIPMSGKRGVIGETFKASGGKRSKRGYKLKMRAHIVKGQRSTLPSKMAHQGGNPPFMAGGVGFTRTTKQKYPIARVVGLGMPQMPINKSLPKVEKAIVDTMKKRLEHNFQQIFK